MRIVVLFNLKPNVDTAAYEEWTRTRGLPGMRALVSVDEFQLYRAKGLLGGGASPTAQYIGIMEVNDREGFDRDFASELGRKLTAELEAFADGLQFIVTEPLSEIRT